MHLDDKKISVSLATLQLADMGGRTTLKVSEQGAFLDGYDDAGSREHGTGYLLDALGASLSLMTCKVIDFAGRPGDSWRAQTAIGRRRTQEREC